jgi:hypothetical protein
MTLSDLASLGSFVSGLAVLVSLVFLYFQVRQAEKNQQTSIRQARINRICDTLLAMVNEPSFFDAIMLGNFGSEDISEIQLRKFLVHVRVYFLQSEDSYHQYRAGLLDETAFKTFKAGFRTTMSTPGYRVAWRTVRDWFGSGFVRFVDELLLEVPISTLPMIPLSQWKADVAAEKATVAAG